MEGKEAPVERIGVSAYKIPTDLPEADGTFAWDSTTMVLVEAAAAGRPGIASCAIAGMAIAAGRSSPWVNSWPARRR